jgi:hypothetical protein
LIFHRFFHSVSSYATFEGSEPRLQIILSVMLRLNYHLMCLLNRKKPCPVIMPCPKVLLQNIAYGNLSDRLHNMHASSFSTLHILVTEQMSSETS